MSAGTCDEFEKYYTDSYTKVYHLALSLAGNENDAEANTPGIDLQVVEEISELRNLRDIYKLLYPQDIDKYLADRIREGIKKKEWTILNRN